MTEDQLNDADAVRRVLGGQTEAFAGLLQRSYPSVRRLCQRLVGAADAEDVAQEASLQAFLRLGQLKEPARFAAWLHAIAANLARMLLRHRRALSLDAFGMEPPSLLPLAMSLPLDPADALEQRETHAAILAALGELSQVNRDVVIGYYLEGYSYNELSAILDAPLSAIKGRLFKSRQHLRRSLEPIARDVLSTIQPQEAPRMSDLREIVLEELYIETWAHRRVVLRERAGERLLVLRMGPFESDALLAAFHGEQTARPQTHDLLLSMLRPLGVSLERVLIQRLAEHTYYATLTLSHDGERYPVEARYSDALVLALRTGAPVFAPADLLAEHGVTRETLQVGRNAQAGTALGVRGATRPHPLLTMPEFIQGAAPHARTIHWQGQPMIAAPLPAAGDQLTDVAWLSLRLAEADEPAWLVVPPAYWDRMREISEPLRPADPPPASNNHELWD